MSGYVNPVFRPEFMGDVAPPQNRLASGFNAIWPASNPVGTETTQGMQSATPVDQIAFMRPDGTPVMQSDLARAHEQVQTAMQVAPTMVLGMMGTTDPPGIRAFHGSPYDFERFDTSKIGTGEGAQAYGHGLYMAGNENVAQSYKFAGQPSYMNQATASVAQDAYQQAIKSGVGDPLAAARNNLWEKRQATTDPVERRRIDDAYNNIEQLTQPGGAGHMYEVNVSADPEQFLHWDKPLSEQSPQVQKAIGYQPRPSYDEQATLLARLRDQGVPPEQVANHPDYKAMEARLDRSNVLENGTPVTLETPGSAIYHGFGKGDPASAAQALQRAGIPGIRYLDQGSRGAQPPIKLVGGKPYDPTDPTHLAAHALDMSSGDRSVAASIADRHAQLRAEQGDAAGADAMHQAATLLQSPRAVPPLTEGQPPGTHNYVVFDANTIDILRKYGLAGLGIGLGATAAGTQQQSQ